MYARYKHPSSKPQKLVFWGPAKLPAWGVIAEKPSTTCNIAI